jgi:membrane-associated phospholipid phosphatase
MEVIWQSGIQFILFLQGFGEWLVTPMMSITFLGDEYFFLIFAPAIAWCFDYSIGLRMGIYLMFSLAINAIFKNIFHMPRPNWLSTDVKTYFPEYSYGIPSGHAQNTMVFWGTLALSVRRKWVWVLSTIIILLVGLSRMYLGVHFPTDILIGWLIGIILLWLLFKIERPVLKWFTRYSASIRILLVLLLSAIGILIASIIKFSLQNWSIPAEWLNNAGIDHEGVLKIFSISAVFTNMGTFCGLAIGAICLSVIGGFDVQGVWWKKVLRFLVGVIGILILYFGLKTIFDLIPIGETTFFAGLIRYVRYAVVGSWVSLFAPWIFIKLHLAQSLQKSDPLPQSENKADLD